MTLLNEIREQADKTQEHVARDLGISARTVIRHETGETKLRSMHRTMYADYYGVKADSIEQPNPAKKKQVAA